jgi:hypothetical protein
MINLIIYVAGAIFIGSHLAAWFPGFAFLLGVSCSIYFLVRLGQFISRQLGEGVIKHFLRGCISALFPS